MTLLRKPELALFANRKWRYALLALLSLAITAAVGIGVQHWYLRAKVKPELAVEVNLLNPDAFLSTQSLSKLPKHLLAAPVFRDLATEDLFFYYREDEGRLGLEGALRRISFEHELGFSDRFIATILDRPAQIAFWKSPNGRLGRWLMVVSRAGLIPVLENLAKAALGDKQLRIAGTLPSLGNPQVFELSHGRNLKLYFASVGEHLWVFSDPGILLHTEPAEVEKITRLLGAQNPSDLWKQSFQLDAQSHVHTLAVSANYLSLGYQTLFPALQALRFDYDAPRGWTAAVSTSTSFPTASRVWSAVPDHPALCAVLPVDPERVAALLSKVVSDDDAEDIADALETPAAVCWYDKAKLYAPLVVMRKNTEDSLGDSLPKLFSIAIGTHEAGTEQSAPPPVNAAKQTDGESDEEVEIVYHPPFDIAEVRQPNGTVWRREVSSPYGTRSSKDSPNSKNMRSRRYFTVALAEWKDVLLFSPDAALVDDAIAVLDGQYPSLGDALPEQSESAVVVYPEHLVNMVKTAVLDSLPDEREPIFRANVSERLLPQLEKLTDSRLTRLPAPTGKSTWEELKWAEQR